MLHTLLSVVIAMAAGLKDIIETDKVTFYIGIGVRYAISYACLCGKVHHGIRMMIREDFPMRDLSAMFPLIKWNRASPSSSCKRSYLREMS